MTASKPQFVLNLSCPDRDGIVAKTATYLFEQRASISEAAQYGDPDTKKFFARLVFDLAKDGRIDALRQGFQAIADELSMDWSLVSIDKPLKILLMVSKYDHCLNDLLYRWRTGTLNVNVVAVVSNHNDLRELVEGHGIPFHYLPVTTDTKSQQEQQVLDLIKDKNIELVVLARYMQILSQNMCQQLDSRCINIHHSFLPSFVGAKPYHAAHDRGVKLIGATAHYVTSDLDQGPIIEQDVHRVNHGHTVEQLIEIGRDIEATVLARAVRWHAEHRIHIDANKTVVFE